MIVVVVVVVVVVNAASARRALLSWITSVLPSRRVASSYHQSLFAEQHRIMTSAVEKNNRSAV